MVVCTLISQTPVPLNFLKPKRSCVRWQQPASLTCNSVPTHPCLVTSCIPGRMAEWGQRQANTACSQRGKRHEAWYTTTVTITRSEMYRSDSTTRCTGEQKAIL